MIAVCKKSLLDANLLGAGGFSERGNPWQRLPKASADEKGNDTERRSEGRGVRSEK